MLPCSSSLLASNQIMIKQKPDSEERKELRVSLTVRHGKVETGSKRSILDVDD
jgi:hypothetical protein